MKELSQQVYEYLLTIPCGRVATYGQIAAFLGNPRLARAVGNILHANPEPLRYPCYKVVNAKGQLAPAFGDGGPEVQRQRLEQEGIRVKDGRVDLTVYGFTDVGPMPAPCVFPETSGEQGEQRPQPPL